MNNNRPVLNQGPEQHLVLAENNKERGQDIPRYYWYRPRQRFNHLGSHFIKETGQEALNRKELLEQRAESGEFNDWEYKEFLRHHNLYSRRNWLSRRDWLNSRLRDQVEQDFQKKVAHWKSKFESEFNEETARTKLEIKTRELQVEKDRWYAQLEHKFVAPEFNYGAGIL